MRSQAITVEYILIILLSLAILGYSYSFLKQHSFYLTDFLAKSIINNQIELLDVYIYNFEGVYLAEQEINLKNVRAFCQNNITIIQTNEKCIPSPTNFEYRGDLIKLNFSYYVFSNRTQTYYPAVKYGYYLLKSCYEGFTSYVINTTSCSTFCINNCKLKILKNKTSLQIK